MSKRISTIQLLGIMLLIALHAFDELVLVIALPTISQELNLADLYGITIASYILAAIAGISWSGHAIDNLGPRKVLLFSLSVFLVGLIISILFPNGFAFVSARILQGFGGGVMTTCAFALINLLSDTEGRSKAVTAIDLAWVFPSLAAPGIGGVLVDIVDWRWIFAIQIPPLLLAGYLVCPSIKSLDREGHQPGAAIIIDALRIALGIGSILYILSLPPSWLWLLVPVAAIIALPAFSRVMPDKWWYGGSALALPILVSLMSFLAFYGMEAFQPLYLIQTLGMSSAQAGFIITAASISWLAGSHSATKLYKRFEHRQIMLMGNSVLITGIVLLTVVTVSESAVVLMYFAWAFAGLGMGLTFNATRNSAMNHTPDQKEGFTATGDNVVSQHGHRPKCRPRRSH